MRQARTRAVRACAATLLLGACACSSATRFPTSTEPPDEPRRAPGISLSRSFAEPQPGESGDGFRVVVSPVDSAKARSTVASFLDAVVSEDVASLSRLLSPGAQQQVGSGGEVRAAADYWQRRLQRLDYGPLRGEALFRTSETRLIRPEQGESASVPLRLESRQVAVEVPLLTTHVGAARVFGPQLTFVLQETGDSLTVTRIIEDFQFL